MRPVYVVNVEGAIVHQGRYLMVVRGRDETHAAGTLALVGGKVETTRAETNILEQTLHREIMEEVGIQVSGMAYVCSSHFFTDDGDAVIDVVFLCRYASGDAHIADSAEVEAIHWLTAEEIGAHPAAPAWTIDSIQQAEIQRRKLNW